ncbi:MAG: SulP family inorganic anion transporter [bacterium]
MQNYDRSSFRADLMAGVTVALVALPQSMAFALIVGIDPNYGIHAVIIGSLVGALFGSSRHLHTGPTNTSSIVIGAAIAPFLLQDNFLGYLFLLSFLAGFFQLGAGILRFGNLTQFISRSVLVGFTGGASVLIFVTQLPNILGLPKHASLSVMNGILAVAKNTGEIDSPTLLIGLGTILLVLLLNKISPRSSKGVTYLPSYLLAVLGAAAVVATTGLADQGVAVVGRVSSTLPPLSTPDFSWQSIQTLVPSALALALISTAEAVASGKSVATLAGDKLQVNQEFVGQGLAKMAVAFFSGMPTSGSFTRTALNYRVGAQTRFASAISAVILSIVVVLFGPLAKNIPIASLAGIIMVIATKMVDWKQVRLSLRTTRSDAAVMLATFLATLVFQLDTAIYIGVALSLVLFLNKVQHPRLIELEYDEANGFQELEPANERHIPEISIVHIEGDIFFGAADFLENEIGRIAKRPGLKVLILRMKRACCLDATSLLALMQFIENMKNNHKLLIISGVTGEVERIFRRSGVDKVIGEENIFFSDLAVLKSTRQALDRALQYINSQGEKKYRVRLFYDRPGQPQITPEEEPE